MEQALRHYRKFHGLPVEPRHDDPLAEILRDKPVKEMIVKVLEQEGASKFRALHVAQRLAEAGMFLNARQANDSVYAVLLRHTNLFEKISPGWYRLTPEGLFLLRGGPQVPLPVKEPKPTGELSIKVDHIAKEHPDWKAPQVLEHLQAVGWDFGGKVAMSAVCMAMARRRRKVKEVNGVHPL